MHACLKNAMVTPRRILVCLRTVLVMRGSLALWLLACSTRARAPGSANVTAVLSPDAMRARRQLQTASMPPTRPPTPMPTVGYAELAKLVASDATAYDRFGYSVAIEGDTVVVGAYAPAGGRQGSGWGAAYIFRTSDGGASYSQAAKLTAADAVASDYFGYSVAIDGNTIVVGTYLDDDDGDRSGSAYVFRTADDRNTHTEIKLTASDAAADERFGRSVAIAGDTVVVAAYALTNEVGPGSESGSAYIFRTTDGGATYGQVAKLNRYHAF